MAIAGLGLVRLSDPYGGGDQHHSNGDDGHLGTTLCFNSRHGRFNHHKLDDRRVDCGTVFVGNAL